MTTTDTTQSKVVDFAHTILSKFVPHLDTIDSERKYTAIFIEQLKSVVDNFVATNAYTEAAPAVYGSSPSASGEGSIGASGQEAQGGTIQDLQLDGQESGATEEVANV